STPRRTPGPRRRSWSSGRWAPPGRRCWGPAAARRAVAGSRNRSRAVARSSGPALSEESADDGGLAGLLEQEAVVTVRRVDDVELDRLAQGPQGRLDLLRSRRRVEPVGAERDEQRARG